MRGFPLINLLAVLGALAALLYPLLRLNTPARAVSPQPDDGETAIRAAEVPVTVGLRFVREPLRLEVKAGGRILEFSSNGLERTVHTALPMPDRALELDMSVTWPPDAAGSVAEVAVAPDGLAEQRQNVWADGAGASEILRFEWKK
ncbi:MAG: hypothetical protein JWM59_743 [Verrucomicrobiales bacterium]|nr:hypothetical protein [Verrucomicrobiales bacterium]